MDDVGPLACSRMRRIVGTRHGAGLALNERPPAYAHAVMLNYNRERLMQRIAGGIWLPLPLLAPEAHALMPAHAGEYAVATVRWPQLVLGRRRRRWH